MTHDELHAYVQTLRCEKCYRKISTYSLEGDYACQKHGLVKPLTEEDIRSRMREAEALANVIP